MKGNMQFVNFGKLFSRMPDAVAIIKGSREYPSIWGVVRFYTVESGVMVRAEIKGLPIDHGKCALNIFGFHIHSGTSCIGNGDDPFALADGHYNRGECPHPRHAGDLLPLMGVKGRAVSAFLTDRFTVSEVRGKAVIIHSMPDDFTTQPAGNSGKKIACGIIV